jgi:hypothetical protein
MYLSVHKSLSLNNIDKIKNTIFTCIPPMSYGKLLTENKYTSKKLRCFLIKRYYNHLK